MTDIEMIRTLTGNNEISDAFISFYLQATEDFVKSYCNIDSIPKGLKSTVLEITALRVKANSNEGDSALGEGIKQIGSITDGNQSISYVGGATAGKQFTSEEDFIAAYGNILGRYRRMVVDKTSQRNAGARRIHHSEER